MRTLQRNGWLSRPTTRYSLRCELSPHAYNTRKVFKHTFDVIEDYLCYFLTGIGSIALAVRFLTSLGSGEVVCAIKGEKSLIISFDLIVYGTKLQKTLLQSQV